MNMACWNKARIIKHVRRLAWISDLWQDISSMSQGVDVIGFGNTIKYYSKDILVNYPSCSVTHPFVPPRQAFLPLTSGLMKTSLACIVPRFSHICSRVILMWIERLRDDCVSWRLKLTICSLTICLCGFPPVHVILIGSYLQDRNGCSPLPSHRGWTHWFSSYIYRVYMIYE